MNKHSYVFDSICSTRGEKNLINYNKIEDYSGLYTILHEW